uniref:Uncharacterized protein n=1 Tax=Meloidogyne floridensis TaxID=298350 RepID=A0A915NS61_9BILA
MNNLIIFLFFFLLFFQLTHSFQKCYQTKFNNFIKSNLKEQQCIVNERFLLYSVNRGEGFNLRRDVYMRVANVVRQLREK